jgi:acetyltransferase-like isoleucine patch superfamily enzyme
MDWQAHHGNGREFAVKFLQWLRRRLFIEIQDGVVVGEGTVIRLFTVICSGATIGARCKIGPHVLIQPGVMVGNDCRVHSHSFLCEGVVLERGVFIGHGVQTCNEKYPKAVRETPWQLNPADMILIREGAVVGNGAVILPGVTIGEGAIVGAGATVTKDVPRGGVVISPEAVPIGDRYGKWGKFLGGTG